MLTEARLSHQAPGRLRIRVHSKRRDASFFSSVKERLSQCPGVESLVINPLTGSVLVLHTTALGPIREYVEAHGLFKLLAEEVSDTAAPAGPIPLSQGIKQGYGDFDRRLRELTGGAMDVSGLAFTALLVVGISQISRGNFAAPAWYTAFWYAFNIFLKGQPAK